MAKIVEDIFTAGDKGWETCEECKPASAQLNKLVDKYAPLKKHLEDVFTTRKVTVLFTPDETHFTASNNTISLPHTTKDADALDLVDAIIFESYNAIRKDLLTSSKTLSDVNFDLLGSGILTAQIEAGTMADFYALAMQMEPGDRTANMEKCVLRAKEAKGEVSAHFLASPHMSDPAKLKSLPPGDERRLPTGVMYVYQNVVNAGTTKIRAVIFKKCGVDFDMVEKTHPINKKLFSEIEPKGTETPLKTAVLALDGLVKKNWPPGFREKRPGVLLKLIELVQQDGRFTLLRNALTETAFGFTVEMKNLAVVNYPDCALKE